MKQFSFTQPAFSTHQKKYLKTEKALTDTIINLKTVNPIEFFGVCPSGVFANISLLSYYTSGETPMCNKALL